MFLPKRFIKNNQNRLYQYFISDAKNDEKKISVFFTVFLRICGLSTALMASSLEVTRVLGLDSIELPESPIKLVQQPIITVGSPFTVEGFLQAVLLIGLPLASRFTIPDRILASIAIRKIRDHNIVQTVPSRNLSRISGSWGIATFVIFFFHGLLVNPNQVQLLALYSLMFAMIIGLPTCISSLFYAYEIEARIQPKLRKYLTNELGIKISSLRGMFIISSDSTIEKTRLISCLSSYQSS